MLRGFVDRSNSKLNFEISSNVEEFFKRLDMIIPFFVLFSASTVAICFDFNESVWTRTMGVAEDFSPSFTQKPQLRQEDDGNKLVFECKLLGCPKPEITWYRNNVKLVEDHRTVVKLQTIGTNTFLAVLEIDDVVETDAGLYKILAKNKMGEMTNSINLNFNRKFLVRAYSTIVSQYLTHF